MHKGSFIIITVITMFSIITFIFIMFSRNYCHDPSLPDRRRPSGLRSSFTSSFASLQTTPRHTPVTMLPVEVLRTPHGGEEGKYIADICRHAHSCQVLLMLVDSANEHSALTVVREPQLRTSASTATPSHNTDDWVDVAVAAAAAGRETHVRLRLPRKSIHTLD